VSPLKQVSVATWLLLAAGVVLAAVAFTLPRLRPVPVAADPELSALRSERDELARHDDATVARLRQQLRDHPAPTWTSEALAARVGPGWRLDWSPPEGASRAVRVVRVNPRLAEWPDYLRAVKVWSATPGVVLESADFAAQGAGPGRRFTEAVIGLRIALGEKPAVPNETSNRPDPSGSLAGAPIEITTQPKP
jgi:hypothetical protein